jgi:hypothetical protein
MFFIETFLRDVLVPTIDLLTSIHFFQHDLHTFFERLLGPSSFDRPPWCANRLLSPFLMGGLASSPHSLLHK